MHPSHLQGNTRLQALKPAWHVWIYALVGRANSGNKGIVQANRHIRNLALTGFMGVGKSTLGRYLAELLHYRFIDTDDLIETRAERSVSEIFTTEGETRFRQMEQALVQETQQWDHTVMATGGGLVTFEDNMERLKQSSFVVCLWAKPETIYERIRRQHHRPLLQTADPLETIRALLEARRVYYRAADLMVITENRPMRVVAQLIIRQYLNARAPEERSPPTPGTPLPPKQPLPQPNGP